MHYPVITISREYGSGGRAIGERLAKELGVPFYDKELIFMAAKESGPVGGVHQENRADEVHQLSLWPVHERPAAAHESTKSFWCRARSSARWPRRGPA